MLAISYRPKVIRVKAGEKVVFHFINNDVAPHDAFVGNVDQQLDREKEVAAESKGASATRGYLLVKAKSAGDLTYRFGKPGRLIIGCHQPGHWDSGMKIAVIVSP
jgi:uncharacterized cupredoxin-like copper-binding protein